MQNLVSPSLNYTQASYDPGGGNHGGCCNIVTSCGCGFGKSRGGGKSTNF